MGKCLCLCKLLNCVNSVSDYTANKAAGVETVKSVSIWHQNSFSYCSTPVKTDAAYLIISIFHLQVCSDDNSFGL